MLECYLQEWELRQRVEQIRVATTSQAIEATIGRARAALDFAAEVSAVLNSYGRIEGYASRSHILCALRGVACLPISRSPELAGCIRPKACLY